MATIRSDTQAEFGRRNRNDDSSSSRESSPIRKHKRSFSPTSDDEVVIEPIADDDTPPPEGPLIRQAVAFSWTPSIATAPASINTYQASPIPTQPHFLPGQEVPAPPPPPKKTRKKTAPQFSSQTNRFRVTSYDPTPPEAPALTSGDGPYASMYRATTTGDGPTTSEPSVAAQTGRRKRPKPSDSKPKASTSKAKVTASKAKSSASKSKASNPNQGSSSTPAQANMALQAGSEPEAGPSRGPYYRRNYEQNNDSHSVAVTSSLTRADLQRLQANRPNPPLRLVTVLIEDTRGDVPDSLAEVRVVLRDSEDTERDGYWANAADICKALQGSPSRIDGPAKVYAWRGKYRQIILKVTPDNHDEWVDANVVVNPDRTLGLVIEAGLPPAALANPPRAQREFPESDPYMSPQVVSRSPYMASGSGFPANQEHGSRKRRRSPSDDYRGRSSSSRQWSPSTLASSPRATPSRGPYQKSFNVGTLDARMHFPGQPSSPEPAQYRRHSPPRYSNSPYKQRSRSRSDSSESDDPEAIHNQLSQEVDQLIQEEPNWQEFFKLHGQPCSAAVVLKEYQVVQGFVDKWVGKPMPSGPLIEKSHIGQALLIGDGNAIERDKYMSDCTETLDLMALYGPEGLRLQDPEVIAKASDDSVPGYQAKPARALLKLLRKVDQQWVAAHPAS
ncbi:hypothetical protein B0H19DRAFT_1093289 [Mycena capillaripes]|nr:hypothetical protein B0H19DRAFT_1093289 [Mycena capillaripes]